MKALVMKINKMVKNLRRINAFSKRMDKDNQGKLSILSQCLNFSSRLIEEGKLNYHKFPEANSKMLANDYDII